MTPSAAQAQSTQAIEAGLSPTVTIATLTAALIAGLSPVFAYLAAQIETYQYVKAINGNSTTAAAGGFDGLIAFAEGSNSPGSNAVMCLYASTVSIGTGSSAGGDFEAGLLSWLQASPTSKPPGVGLSANSTPPVGTVLAALRASAISQTF